MNERDVSPTEDRVSNLFTPDTLVPSQFFDRLRRNTEHYGERRLMVAVLEDALDVYRKRCGFLDQRSQEMFLDAEAWINASDREWLFSFENICSVLDIEPDYIRRGLRAWRSRFEATGRHQVIPFPTEEPAELELRNASGQR